MSPPLRANCPKTNRSRVIPIYPEGRPSLFFCNRPAIQWTDPRYKDIVRWTGGHPSVFLGQSMKGGAVHTITFQVRMRFAVSRVAGAAAFWLGSAASFLGAVLIWAAFSPSYTDVATMFAIGGVAVVGLFLLAAGAACLGPGIQRRAERADDVARLVP
jgi:hypothetical protein